MILNEVEQMLHELHGLRSLQVEVAGSHIP